MDFDAIVENWINGNKKDVAKEIKEYGYHCFVVGFFDEFKLHDCELLNQDVFLQIIKYYSAFEVN